MPFQVYIEVKEEWVDTLDEILKKVQERDNTFKYKFVKDASGTLYLFVNADKRSQAHWRGSYLKTVIYDRFRGRKNYAILEEEVVKFD